MMNRQITSEVESLAADTPREDGEVITLEAHPHLPDPVRRHLQFARVQGRPRIRFARFRHGGTFRAHPDAEWLPMEGEGYLATSPPGFVWTGLLRSSRLMWVRGRDLYRRGSGNMLIKPLSLLTLANVRGPEMDVSALLRLLSEWPLVPTALAPSDVLRWEALDATSARARLRDGALEVSGTFHFDSTGRVLRFETNGRYRDGDGRPVRTPWMVEYHPPRIVDGLWVPMGINATWRVPDGDFPYARFPISEIEFGTRERFPRPTLVGARPRAAAVQA